MPGVRMVEPPHENQRPFRIHVCGTPTHAEPAHAWFREQLDGGSYTFELTLQRVR